MSIQREKPAWHIGAAIEAGIDEQEARKRINAGEVIAPAAGVAVGSVAAATATGLGGVGIAMGGGAIGIGAATAVAAPAVAAGAVGYGIYRGIRELKKMNRDRTIRELIRYFRETTQPHQVERIFSIEGMGRLEDGRRPPSHSSATATLLLLAESENSVFMGLFCSPKGEFVLTYDSSPLHWAYVRLIGKDKFSGGGKDLRGQDFTVDDINNMKLLLRMLEREEFLQRREIETSEE